jgi:hypothetical protein
MIRQAREIILCENFEKHVWEVAFVLKAGGPDLTVCDASRLGVLDRRDLVPREEPLSQAQTLMAAPHSWALFGMAAAEALVPGFRHTVYVWGTKSAEDGIVPQM